ncbi:MAG: hypothetical protein V1853_05365 [bacterium]
MEPIEPTQLDPGFIWPLLFFAVGMFINWQAWKLANRINHENYSAASMFGSLFLVFVISAEVPFRFLGGPEGFRIIFHIGSVTMGFSAVFFLIVGFITSLRQRFRNKPRPLGPRVKSVFIRLLPWTFRGPQCWLASALNR